MTISPINSAIADLNAPPIPIVQRSANSYDGSCGPLIDLSQAVPGYAAHPSLTDSLNKAAGRADLLGYGRIEGEMELRTAYSTHVSQVYGAEVTPLETHITSGCNQAFVATALTVAGPGDSILLITPFYFNHATTLEMLGIHTKSVPADPGNGFLPDPDRVAAAITPDVKAVVCVTPNNPTGAIYPTVLIEALYDICVANNVWLITDETYRDFLPSDQRRPHKLFERSNWRQHFINLYSFSKSFCIPGHRLGAVTAGEELVTNLAKVMDNLQICAPRPPQHAVAKGLVELSDWQQENRKEIDFRRSVLQEVIAGLPQWEIAAIGAYFSYIAHPFKDRTSTQVAEYLASKRGVVCLPGAFFGQGQEPNLRFAFANASGAELKELTARLA